MTTLNTHISSDFRNVLLDTNEYGETVSYRVRHGASKSIVAVIRKHEPELVEEDANGRRWRHVISATISTNTAAGIAAPAWGDTIEYAGLSFKIEPPEKHAIGETAGLIGIAFSEERFVQADRIRRAK